MLGLPHGKATLIKILLDTNAPWMGTGYGTQAALFAPRFQALGHQVAISAMGGLTGQVTEYEGIPCLPGGMTRYGNDVRRAHAEQFFQGGPGLVLVLYDAWVLDPRSTHGLATAVWSPVHSHPMSAGDRQFYARTAAQPIAMSRYGEREMRAAGLQPLYVPHGVDTSVFKPLSEDQRREVRESIGVSEDTFLIAIVAANKGVTPPRKAWAEQFQAFAQFKRKHPDAVLYCHTLIGGPEALDLSPILSDLGLGNDVLFSGQYQQLTGLYPPQFVAGLMGAADVLSNPSYGEGFGLAALEAQACGTPVVVADNSAQTELCGSGWLVECQPFWQIGDEAWWHVPSVKGIVSAWEKAYKHARKPEMRARARDFAMAYDADTVLTQYWKPALEMLEQYCGAAPVRSPLRNHGSIPLPTAEADGLKWIQRGGHTDDWIAVSHEDSLAPVLDAMLPDGGVFLDVGAHVGRWSLRLARKASRVISVEANPDTAAVLQAHIELNGVTNVDVLGMAAWDAETQMTLDDPNQRVNGGSTRVIPGDGAVQARPLDAVLGDISPDLIKLDVEGADLHALRGMRETLARCRPKLFIEDHSIYGYYKLADLEALLTELGYRHERTWFPLPHGARSPYLIAEPEDGNGQEDHA